MGQAIGQSLPTAVGVALSPLPIVAVVLMLVTPRGRVNGSAFVVGWWLGLTIVGTVTLLIAGGAGSTEHGEPASWVNWAKLVVGILLLGVAIKQWRGRPVGDEEVPPPKWMGALDSFTPPKALGAGALFAGVNPKNTLLTIAGAATIAGTGLSTGQQIGSYVVFVVVASIGVAAPVAMALVMGEKARPLLDGLKNWMSRNNTVIMSVLLLIVAVKLIGDAITGFSM